MFQFAVGNLLSRPVRTGLSVLGLAVAIGGMVGLFSIAGGMDRLVRSTFAQIPGLLVQQRGSPFPLFSTLPAGWQTELEAMDGVRVVDPQVFTRLNVIDGETIVSPPRLLVGVDIAASHRLNKSVYINGMTTGRFLEVTDRGSRRCVISQTVADQFDKQAGNDIQLNRVTFEIVGIFETGSLMLDVNLLTDISIVRQLTRVGEETVNCFYVEPDGSIDNSSLKRAIEQRFLGRDQELQTGGASLFSVFNNLDRLVKGTGSLPRDSDQSPEIREPPISPRTTTESPVEVRTSDDWSTQFDEFSGDLNLFLGVMTTIGVAIALISILNTMLMSVTERTTEFGILRANGWSQRNIVQLMTLESSLIGVTGGIVGILAGWFGTHLVNLAFPDRLNLYASPMLLATALAFSTLVGLGGGVYPAWTASKLSPMESIRRG